MSLNAILGHPDADSLVTLAQAAAYAAKHPAAETWSALSAAEQETLLVTATRHLAWCPLAAPPLVDTLGLRRCQALPLPTARHPHFFGRAQGGTTTTLVDADLATYANDVLAGGSVLVYQGAGRGQWATVDSFAGATGTLTLSPAWSAAPDATSQYLLLWPLPPALRAAAIEQALYLAGGVSFRPLEEAAMGVTEASTAGDGGGSVTLAPSGTAAHLAPAARALLARAGVLRDDQSVEIGRG